MLLVPEGKAGCEEQRGLPHVEGWVKASRRLMRKGCLRRRRMQTSRSTRLACSGLLSTSGMRFRATCSTATGAFSADTGNVLATPETANPYSMVIKLLLVSKKKTRLACSGLLSTSGMRFRATCSTAAGAELTQVLSLRRQRLRIHLGSCFGLLSASGICFEAACMTYVILGLAQMMCMALPDAARILQQMHGLPSRSCGRAELLLCKVGHCMRHTFSSV